LRADVDTSFALDADDLAIGVSGFAACLRGWGESAKNVTPRRRSMSTCPATLDHARLRERIRATYERVAASPQDSFHFHVGADYAVATLGYDAAELATLPEVCTRRFAGVGNPHRAGVLPIGATVLDHACGAGMDLLLAARRVGPTGRAIGIDVTPGMRECAIAAASEARLENVEVRAGTFENLPVDDASVDVAISNGVLNLAPDKLRVLEQLARVVKPGGELWLADVVLGRELAADARSNADLWAACVGGALTLDSLMTLADRAGFEDVQLVERYDAFADTRLAAKFGRSLDVGAATLRARRP
jgi:arsenite methyltransferase